jgi:hypothetical protein
MAFCGSCGEDIQPGSKFCENCGAPVEPATAPAPAAPPEPATGPVRQPLVPAPPPAKPVPVPLIVGILVVIGIVAAVVLFGGLPYLKNAGTRAEPTPVPTTKSVTPEPTLPDETPVPPVTPTVTVRKLDTRYAEYYDEICSLDQFFAFGQKETFTHDLATPPLYIKFNLTPTEITKSKVINIGLSNEETIYITYANPNAWFEVKVFDADSGAVIDAQGYGKDYPDMTRREFMVRNAGNYRVEMSGNDVMADISILKGKS